MKTKFTLKLAAVVLWFATLGLPLSTAFAQGTAFTYQGRLFSGANAANGTYNLTFSLYNLSSGGALQAGPVTTNGVVISNGLFTVWVDFGPGVFNGSGGASYVTNWLQIGVESNGVGSFTTLTPRQGVTPAPYSIFAEGANAAGLSGTIPSGVLSGVSGIGLTGVALLAGGNTFSGNQIIDDMLQISDGAGAGYHTDEVIGPGAYDSGEEHSINFDDGAGHIGSLIVGWNGANGYFSAGNLYTAGTHETGTKSFTVFGNGNVNIDPTGLNAGFLNNGNPTGSGLTFGIASGEGIASQRTAGTDQDSLDFYTSFSNRMTILQDGFVGINTTNPLARLHVLKGSGSGSSDSYNGGPAIFADTSTGDGIYVNTTDGGAYGVWANGPSIGVWGATTGGTGVEGSSSTGNGVYGTSGSGYGVEGTSSSSIGVYGAYQGSTGTAAGVEGDTASTSSSANGVYGLVSSGSPGGFSAAVRGQNNGTNGAGIGVYGSQAGSGWGVFGTTPGGIGVYGTTSTGTGVEAESSSGTGLYAFSGTGDAIDAYSSSGSALTIENGPIHVSGAGVNTSTAAFIQLSTGANTGFYSNATRINNPLCNGDPHAILLVTHNPSGQTSYSNYNHAVGVWYDGSYWEIYSEDVSAMPTNVAFNVLIIKN